MDTINLRVLVNLSGGSGEELRKTVATMKGRYPDRFVVFANPSYEDINEPGYGNRAAERLAADVRNGAQGLKIFKDFGMDEQQGRIVEMRFFGGLSIEEIGEVLGVSRSTVKREWNVAKAWLTRQMKRGSRGEARSLAES